MEIKNVLIVYDYAYINGGSARVAIQSAIGLSKYSNYNIFYFSGVGPVCCELEKSTVTIRNIDINDINGNKKIKSIIDGIWNKNVRKELRKFLVDNNLTKHNTIVHFHGIDKALSCSVLYELREYKCFYTIHDYSVFCPNGGLYNYRTQTACEYKPMGFHCLFCNCDKRSYFQKIWRMIRQLIKNIVLNNQIVFISISELCNKFARKYIKRNKIIKIYDLISDYHFINTKINEEEYCYVYVGRISEEKGLDIFCKAITAAKEQNDKVTGVVVGDGEGLTKLKKEYSNISFVGWQNEDGVKKYISEARALVFPSKCYETAGLTVLEAMAMGTPCIVSDQTAASEFVINGKSGFLFKHMDISSLCKVIEKSFDNNVISKMRNYLKYNFDERIYLQRKHTEKLIEAYQIYTKI